MLRLRVRVRVQCLGLGKVRGLVLRLRLRVECLGLGLVVKNSCSMMSMPFVLWRNSRTPMNAHLLRSTSRSVFTFTRNGPASAGYMGT